MCTVNCCFYMFKGNKYIYSFLVFYWDIFLIDWFKVNGTIILLNYSVILKFFARINYDSVKKFYFNYFFHN